MTKIAGTETILYTATDGRTVDFIVSSVLVREGDAAGKDWKDQADKWKTTVQVDSRAAGISFDYHTGVGLRRNAAGETRPWRDSDSRPSDFKPVPPDAMGVLSTIASDAHSAQELPGDDAAALDFAAGEWGWSNSPGQMLRTIQAMRDHDQDGEALLSVAGVSLDDLLAWLDSHND